MSKENQTKLISRSPVVVVMGHIDHGKSTLLDYVRKTNVVAGEAGGITQHMSAYEAEHIGDDGRRHTITFLDTPGHVAFCGIRQRGASAADVAILIVSAEDGVKPQTVEALNNIKQAKIPYIVAITKIDKTNANIEKTKQSLGENEIYVEGWGGDIPCVAISATTGSGVKELLDLVILLAEIVDPKTNTDAPASGIIIESARHRGKGINATLIIKNGTLKVGSFICADNAHTPVRYIENFLGKKIDNAQASMPISVLGWNIVPKCGSDFITVNTKKEAEILVENYIENKKNNENKSATIEKKKSTVKKNDDMKKDDSDKNIHKITILPIILKSDTIGSLEGIKNELSKIAQDKTQIKIVA